MTYKFIGVFIFLSILYIINIIIFDSILFICVFSEPRMQILEICLFFQIYLGWIWIVIYPMYFLFYQHSYGFHKSMFKLCYNVSVIISFSRFIILFYFQNSEQYESKILSWILLFFFCCESLFVLKNK